MKKAIDIDHIERSFRYSKWIQETLTFGSSIVQPVIICWDYPEPAGDKKALKEKRLKKCFDKYELNGDIKKLKIYTYGFKNGNIELVPKR